VDVFVEHGVVSVDTAAYWIATVIGTILACAIGAAGAAALIGCIEHE
jgi:hypothetical protein